ncbi:hypothetical protein [Campylobacter sp. 19-13652]|uniref:hypothetical protein n=1 Tax=Campylobacter sp. 19-13652 TaxID=2840180 RepID=UPI001C7973D2|nr:hypothetical protein [Campylobacter sp. 19-13652]BCX79214.1 hypothetical protein LBC_06760 [Campylobacter sp. 19-13652]
MKDAKSIITKHFFNNPIYKGLSAAAQCHTLIELLPNNVKPLIAFVYAKGELLFIVVKHPVGLSELKRDSSINMIKGLLRAINAGAKLNGQPSALESIKDIRISVLKTPPKQINLTPIPPIKTPLKSKAKFINLAKNKEVFKAFERLRNVIKERICKP